MQASFVISHIHRDSGAASSVAREKGVTILGNVRLVHRLIIWTTARDTPVLMLLFGGVLQELQSSLCRFISNIMKDLWIKRQDMVRSVNK